MITFNEAAFLDGYQTVFGELVEGEAVLAEIEKHVDRHGKVNGDLSIIAGGQK
jgi:cyclophilin family peptidyl-prolyl cis-trans isomerase